MIDAGGFWLSCEWGWVSVVRGLTPERRGSAKISHSKGRDKPFLIPPSYK